MFRVVSAVLVALVFVSIFVLSVRIKQVILFVWISVFSCKNDVNIKACVAISTF